MTHAHIGLDGDNGPNQVQPVVQLRDVSSEHVMAEILITAMVQPNFVNHMSMLIHQP